MLISILRQNVQLVRPSYLLRAVFARSIQSKKWSIKPDDMEDLKISGMKVVPCTDSRFVCPSRVEFEQHGIIHVLCRPFVGSFYLASASVSILLFNTTRQAFVLVKQFRPAVYMHANDKMIGLPSSSVASQAVDTPIIAPFERGVTYEMPAGIIDQSRTPVEIAKSECLEECGYDVPLESFKEIFISTCSGGHTANTEIKFFAEVTDENIVTEGGGNQHEGEIIELFYLPLEDAKDFVFDQTVQKPAAFIASFLWYFWKNKI